MAQTEDTITLKMKVRDDGTLVVENFQKKLKNFANKTSHGFRTAGQSMKDFIKDVAKSAGVFVTTAALITGIVAGFKSLTRESMTFSSSYNQVINLVDDGKSQLADYREELYATTGAMGNLGSVTEGTYQMISSGQAPVTALNKLKESATFAKGAQVDLKSAVAVGTTYLNAYGDAAGGLTHIYDVLWQTIRDGVTTGPELAHAMGRVIPVAKEAGLTIEEASGSIAVMTQISQNTNETVTSLRGILASVIKPTKEAADEAARIGVEFNTAAIKSMGFTNWLQTLLEKVEANNGDMSLLFSQVEALNGIFQLTRENLSVFTGEMDKMQNVTGNSERAFERYKKSFTGAWQTMTNKLQAIFIKEILPLLKEAAEFIGKNAHHVSNFVKTAIDGFKSVVKLLYDFKDVVIQGGKAWLTYFAAAKAAKYFSIMTTGLDDLVTYYKVLKIEGKTSMAAMAGGLKEVTGQTKGLGAAFAKLPKAVRITVGVIGLGLLDTLIEKAEKLKESWFGQYANPDYKELDEVHAGVKYLLDAPKLWADSLSGMDQFKARIEIIKAKMEEGLQLNRKELAFLKEYSDISSEQIAILSDVETAKKKINDLIVDGISILDQSIQKWMGVSSEVAMTAAEKRTLAEITEILNTKITKTNTGVNDLNEAIKGYASSINLLTEKQLKKLNHEQNVIIGLWGSKYKTEILSSAEKTKKLSDRIGELHEILGDRLDPELLKINKKLKANWTELTKTTVHYEDANKVMERATGVIKMLNPAVGNSIELMWSQRDGLRENYTLWNDYAHVVANLAMGKMPPLNNALAQLVASQDKSKDKIKTWGDNWDTASQKVQFALDIINGMADMLEALGITLDDTTRGLLNLANAAGSIAIGIIEKDPTAIIGGVVNAFGALFDMFGSKGPDWQGEAKAALSGVTSATVSMREELASLAEEMGSTRLAYRELMADFIEQSVISEKTFNQWAREVLTLFDHIGEVTTGIDSTDVVNIETVENLNQAFEALVQKADEFGMHGSAAMIAIIKRARELGIEVPSIIEYVKEQFKDFAGSFSDYLNTFEAVDITRQIQEVNQSLLDGAITQEEAAKRLDDLLTKYGEVSGEIVDDWDFIQNTVFSAFNAMRDSGATFVETLFEMKDQFADLAAVAELSGIEVSDGMREILDLSSFIEANENLVNRIQATAGMMEALGNSSYLLEEDFANFGDKAVNHFNNLIEAGATERQALMLIGPELENLIKFSESYGYTIGENTQAIIDQAREEGVLNDQRKTDSEIMIDLLQKIVVLLGGDLNDAVVDLGILSKQTLEDLEGKTREWEQSLQEVGGEFSNLEDGITHLDKVYADRMTGHSIVTETKKWKNALVEVDGIMYRMQEPIKFLDEKWKIFQREVSEETKAHWQHSLRSIILDMRAINREKLYLETEYANTMEKMESATKTWEEQLEKITEKMEDATGEDFANLEIEYQKTMEEMALGTENFQTYLNDLSEELGVTIPRHLNTLQQQYWWVMEQMMEATGRYVQNAEGELVYIRDLLAQIGRDTQSVVGAKYDVYTEEQKLEKTAEFERMAHLYESNKGHFLRNEDILKNFVRDLQRLQFGIIDESKVRYEKTLTKVLGHLAASQSGKFTEEYLESIGLHTGGWFVVPPGPGHSDPKRGMNVRVHEGELVQVYPKERSREILSHYSGGNDTGTTIHEQFLGQPPRKEKVEISIKVENKPSIKIEVNGGSQVDIDKIKEFVIDAVSDNDDGYADRLAAKVYEKLKDKMETHNA